MKKLIVIRHGSYTDDRLNDLGRSQITNLINALKKKHINNDSVFLLTSTALRAVDSAAIIAEILKVNYEEHEVLWSESKHPEDLEALLELVESKENEADVLILVTHYEYTGKFPAYFASKKLDIGYWCDMSIKNGEAWVIDCEAKTIGMFACIPNFY